jgi:hypothetical protein
MTRVATRNLAVSRSAFRGAPASDLVKDRRPRVLAKGRELASLGLQHLQSIRLHRVPQVGRAGGAGLLLTTASIVFWFSTIQPLERNVTSLEGELARVEAASVPTAGGRRSPSEEVAAVLRRLPTRDELPAIMAIVVAQASEAGLDLESGRYELASARSGELARYRLTFPVRGSYPQLREFIDGTLAAVPSLALEGLRLERASITDKAISADLRFAAVVRIGK